MYKLLAFVTVLFLSSACSTDDEPYSYLHDLEVEAETVDLKYQALSPPDEWRQTFQARELYIIWGDGTTPAEYVFRGSNDSIASIRPVSHTFTSEGEYDVKVRALQLDGIILGSVNANQITEAKLTNSENLRRFTCDSQNITELDFTECPAIERVTLYNNLQLDAAGLNRMFESLPIVTPRENDTEPRRHVIALRGNSGDSDCERSIALAKGWVFE